MVSTQSSLQTMNTFKAFKILRLSKFLNLSILFLHFAAVKAISLYNLIKWNKSWKPRNIISIWFTHSAPSCMQFPIIWLFDYLICRNNQPAQLFQCWCLEFGVCRNFINLINSLSAGLSLNRGWVGDLKLGITSYLQILLSCFVHFVSRENFMVKSWDITY